MSHFYCNCVDFTNFYPDLYLILRTFGTSVKLPRVKLGSFKNMKGQSPYSWVKWNPWCLTKLICLVIHIYYIYYVKVWFWFQSYINIEENHNWNFLIHTPTNQPLGESYIHPSKSGFGFGIKICRKFINETFWNRPTNQQPLGDFHIPPPPSFKVWFWFQSYKHAGKTLLELFDTDQPTAWWFPYTDPL